MLLGLLGMTFVGGSVAVSGALADAPDFTVQALRYAVACLLLLGWARIVRHRVVAPRGTDWRWLLGITATGMVVFNIALVEGSEHAEPAVLGVAVACVPLLLAVLGPILEGRGPAPVVVLAAAVVTIGAVLVEGLGRADGTGLLCAVLVFACEACFTLMAVPLLGRHGALGVSVHTTWLAALVFAALALLREGPAAVSRLHADDLLAGAYLAVLMTAVAFVLWYTCVQRIGAARSGLLTGVVPVVAAGTGVVLGGPAPHPLVLLGVLVVAAGLTLGLRTPRVPAAVPVTAAAAPPARAGSPR